jgi:hypothetical protein
VPGDVMATDPTLCTPPLHPRRFAEIFDSARVGKFSPWGGRLPW